MVALPEPPLGRKRPQRKWVSSLEEKTSARVGLGCGRELTLGNSQAGAGTCLLAGPSLLGRWPGRTQCPIRLCSPRVLQNRRVILATFAAVLGNFSFGYALVFTSPVIPALERSSDPALHLTKNQASWFGVRTALPSGRWWGGDVELCPQVEALLRQPGDPPRPCPHTPCC